MAEFVEVMKQKKRMCNDKCAECKLSSSHNSDGLVCSEFCVQYPQEAEKIIMDWAKEHPIKTNEQKFKEVFGYEIDTSTCHRKEDCDGYCDLCSLNDFWEKEYKEPKGEEE